MHFHHKDRPKTQAGIPALLWEGQPVGPLPSITLLQLNPDVIWITAHPLIALATARTLYWDIPEKELDWWLARWWEEPEEVLLAAGWKYSKQASAPSKPPAQPQGTVTLSLSDLGL
jgi:hypothetical protein